MLFEEKAMPRIPINGIEIDYQEYGEGEAIVFAHGAGGNLLSWWQQTPYFAPNYWCIVFSHRGFGHSYDVPDGPGMASFVEDLEGLLDHLEIQSAHLVAQSMGGRTMLGFAVANSNRTRSLVLADTTGGMGEPDVEKALDDWRASQNATRESGSFSRVPHAVRNRRVSGF
jgi:3-oxoadipate enol-lactonase